MSNNPLKPAILTLLKATKEGISEYQIIRHLEADEGLFPENDESADLTLFKKHFIVMNALYQLQQSLLGDGFYLSISPLSIELQVVTNNGETALGDSADAKLRDYYLDWSQLDGTTEKDVSELLNGFWERYLAIDKKAEALITLGLEGEVAWNGIQQQYRRLAAQHHPDRGGDQDNFIAIREAYEILNRCFNP